MIAIKSNESVETWKGSFFYHWEYDDDNLKTLVRVFEPSPSKVVVILSSLKGNKYQRRDPLVKAFSRIKDSLQEQIIDAFPDSSTAEIFWVQHHGEFSSSDINFETFAEAVEGHHIAQKSLLHLIRGDLKPVPKVMKEVGFPLKEWIR